MPMFPKRVYRISLAVMIIGSAALLFNSYVAYSQDPASKIKSQATLPTDERTPIVSGRDNITVMTTQNTGTGGGTIIAFAPDGRLLYYNNSYHTYLDVDPVEGTRATVEYVALQKKSKSECNSETVCDVSVVDRVNLSTGEAERIYSHYQHDISGSTAVHDVDRIDDHRLLVADIALDRIFIVNTTTGIITWEWTAHADYAIDSGGRYPSDWTHMNDVEYLQDGRIMASLRNQDQVVFLDRETGVIEGWTLGSDDNHSVLYEQHNPDYIPRSDGGPAVIVSDSENNRVVEYQRRGTTWVQTWVWQDDSLLWPRDADRLPNGHTLISDSNGHRLLEVNQDGEVVWSVRSELKIYEAERLGTGPESSNGPSAAAAKLTSKQIDSDGQAQQRRSLSTTIFRGIKRTLDLFPLPVMNAVFFVLPGWVGIDDLFPLLGVVIASGMWIILELYWHPYSVSLHNPLRIRRRE